MRFLNEPDDGEPVKGAGDGQPSTDLGVGLPNPSDAHTRLGIVDEFPFTLECISRCLSLLRRDLRVLTFASIEDCLMADPKDFDLVLFHMHCGRIEQSDRICSSLAAVFRLFPVIILSDIDNSNWVIEALESGARGFIPTGSTSVAVAAEIIRLVRAGGIFVPPTSLQQLQHSESSPGSLTQRQRAVLHHLTEGKSNKIIAHELGMSESTVKVHVRSIMKKLQATNRTQAVFRARTLAVTQTQLLPVPVRTRRHLGVA